MVVKLAAEVTQILEAAVEARFRNNVSDAEDGSITAGGRASHRWKNRSSQLTGPMQ